MANDIVAASPQDLIETLKSQKELCKAITIEDLECAAQQYKKWFCRMKGYPEFAVFAGVCELNNGQFYFNVLVSTTELHTEPKQTLYEAMKREIGHKGFAPAGHGIIIV